MLNRDEIAENLIFRMREEIIQSFRVLKDGSIEELFDSRELLYWTYEQGVDWAGLNPDYYNLFETYEGIDTPGHILWHLGGMIDDLINEGVEFDVWQGVVDTFPENEDDEPECVGWYIAAKQVGSN